MPAWPKAGPDVANELDRVCPIIKNSDGTEASSCPAIDEWLSRLVKLKLQMEVSK
jgi:phage/plasmid-associated DNA primase